MLKTELGVCKVTVRYQIRENLQYVDKNKKIRKNVKIRNLTGGMRKKKRKGK